MQQDVASRGAESLGQINAHILRETWQLLNEKRSSRRAEKTRALGLLLSFLWLTAGGLEWGVSSWKWRKQKAALYSLLVKISWGNIVLKPIGMHTKSKLEVSHCKSYVQIKWQQSEETWYLKSRDILRNGAAQPEPGWLCRWSQAGLGSQVTQPPSRLCTSAERVT